MDLWYDCRAVINGRNATNYTWSTSAPSTYYVYGNSFLIDLRYNTNNFNVKCTASYSGNSLNGQISVLSYLCGNPSPNPLSYDNSSNFMSYIDFFPNPTTENLFIKGAPVGSTITVYNTIGEAKHSEIVINNERIELNLNDQSNGVYVCNINFNGSSISKRIVINQ